MSISHHVDSSASDPLARKDRLASSVGVKNGVVPERQRSDNAISKITVDSLSIICSMGRIDIAIVQPTSPSCWMGWFISILKRGSVELHAASFIFTSGTTRSSRQRSPIGKPVDNFARSVH